ncbi:MAG: lantibiotic immunity ABC transporter MutE/EpiE family permease subunit [Oscillospiraceae bacterium]
MLNYIKADFLKQKHKFTLKLLWLAPITPMILSLALMGGMFFTENSFNWWYTLLLPAAISMIVAFNTSAEKRYNRHGLFSVCVSKRKLWLSGVISNSISLLIINLVFFLLISLFTWFFGFELSMGKNFFACLVLFITFAWQIPLLMLLSEKTGKYITIFTALISNIAFGIFFAPTKLWIVPFAIPSRLMCPIVGVMPNGLPVQSGSNLADSSVIMVGILIPLILYFMVTFFTASLFDKSEVK